MVTFLYLLGAACLAYVAFGERQCADKAINFGHKLRTSARFQDQDGDGFISKEESANDVINRYDKNGDGVWTEAECADRNACDLGDASPMAAFSCNFLFQNLKRLAGLPVSQGRINIADLAASYPGVPTAEFVGGLRLIYQIFAAHKCVKRCLAVEEKLAIAAAVMDPDNNGYVDKKHAIQAIANADINKDGVVTESEYVAAWICLYGDPSDLARMAWTDYKYDVIGKIVIADLSNSDMTPIPIDVVTTINRKRYETFELMHGKIVCEDAVSGCAQRGLSLQEKIDINERSIDISPSDGVFSKEEMLADLRDNIDIDGDGTITQRECVTRGECRYGDNTLVATFICNLFLQTEDSQTITEIMENRPSSVPAAKVARMLARNYAKFESLGCTDRCLNDTEKAEKEARDMDMNGDGVISEKDISGYFRRHYGKDLGRLSSQEWIMGHTCRYGTSALQARFRWGYLSPRTMSVTDWATMAQDEYIFVTHFHPEAALDRPCTPGVADDGDNDDEDEEEDTEEESAEEEEDSNDDTESYENESGD